MATTKSEQIIFEKRSLIASILAIIAVFLIIVSIPFWAILIIGGYFSLQEGNVGGGLFSLIIGSVMAAGATRLLWISYKQFTFRRFPVMIITDDGLQFHIATKQIIIPWNEVANARIQLVKFVTTIRIEPKVPRKYHGRFQPWVAPEFMIGTVALKGSAEVLLEAIKGHPKYIGARLMTPVERRIDDGS